MKTFDEKRRQLLSLFNTEEETLQKSTWVENWREDSLVKGGEGARGGIIIGHTRSGKPIYQGSNTPQHDSHKKFTSDDHHDASELHRRRSLKASNEKDWEGASRHNYASNYHYKQKIEKKKLENR